MNFKPPELLMKAALLVLFLATATATARNQIDSPRAPSNGVATPAVCTAAHNIGALELMMVNNGTFGDGYATSSTDFFSGQIMRSCEYPIGSATRYLFVGALWVGAVVGRDTLVSTAADGWTGGTEFYPDEIEYMSRRSTLDSSAAEFAGAVSHQDLVSVYYDTCTKCVGVRNDVVDGRPHIPLGLRIDQTSYAWAYSYSEDFVIMEFRFTKIAGDSLRNGYVGFYVDADVYPEASNSEGAQDDICGFLNAPPPQSIGTACPANDTLHLAWIADNDGDLDMGPALQVPHVTATEVLGSTGATLSAFNWWISNGDSRRDFGPQGRQTYRDLGTGGMGTPEGDRNKYWFLHNHEFDYDQIYTAAILPTDTQWMYPTQNVAVDLSNGYDTRYLLSFGPFDLDLGQSVSFAIAYVGGMNLHTQQVNEWNLEPGYYNPTAYYANLDFSDLLTNAQWAKWVYDNPGIDTDSDGYAGKGVVCNGDTVWYSGDGIPDLVAAGVPVTPSLTAYGDQGKIIVHWNGWRSETSPDRFTHTPDFEGYDVFLKKNESSEPFALVSSYDREDYTRVRFNQVIGEWEFGLTPFSIETLREKYAAGGTDDSTWSPSYFTKSNPFFWMSNADSAFYFVPVGCNASRLGHETKIVKQFPYAPKPTYTSPGDVPTEEASIYLDDQGQFKFYDYELVIEGLLAEQAYRVGITAFDYGPGGKRFLPFSSPMAIVSPVSPAISSCCNGRRGNVDCDPAGNCDIADLTALLDFLFISGQPLCCPEAANFDESEGSSIDIADLSAMIDQMFINFGELPSCP